MEFKNIVSDWQKRFPILSQYTSSTLYAKAGIILIGLRLDKVMSDTYRVILEILPLWVPEKRMISIPVFFVELFHKDGRQFFIEYQLHKHLFDAAAECANQQFALILQENIRVNDIFRFINSFSSTLIPKHNPVDWHRLFELKLALAFYLGEANLIDTIKAEIENETKYWNEKDFNRIFMKSIEEWKIDLYQKMENREMFMKQVQLNLDDKKISKLKRIHILSVHDGI